MNSLAETETNPIIDKENPRAIINIVPAATKRAIETIPDAAWEMTEKELKEASGSNHTVDLIRISFWREYDRAQLAKKNIVISNVYGGVCGQQTWVQRIQANPLKLAYVLTPPTDYTLKLEAALTLATDQILEILSLPNTRKDGSPDAILGGVKHKIWETLLDRVRGAVVTRSESKVLQANMEVKDNRTVSIDDLTPDQIDEMLEAHDQKKALNAGSGEVIDVTIETESRSTED